jgi:hypothetical protein
VTGEVVGDHIDVTDWVGLFDQLEETLIVHAVA